MSDGSPRILFLLPYPIGKAPSQRFRVEALLPLLDEVGFRYTLRPFMTNATWQVLYKGGSAIRKAAGILRGYLGRLKTVLWEAPHYDWVFIHREASPLGPPVFEWYLKKVLGKKIIYDFDDAIWIPNTSAQNSLAAGLKAFWKVSRICSWSHTITAGNDYLCAYARQHSKGRIVKMPTVVDTSLRYNRLKQHGEQDICVGWTGSHSTLKYLDQVKGAIAALQQELSFRFLIIADKEPQLSPAVAEFIPWNPQTEIEDLLKIDIGIMPLTHDPWSEGKCGFKLIQYMALGIPAIASPIGVNTAIIDDAENGFLYNDEQGFTDALQALIADAGLRTRLGAAAREKIVSAFSVDAIRSSFQGLFVDESLNEY
jgi:glycosyltransferase involved in cell wall biosynthesis